MYAIKEEPDTKEEFSFTKSYHLKIENEILFIYNSDGKIVGRSDNMDKSYLHFSNKDDAECEADVSVDECNGETYIIYSIESGKVVYKLCSGGEFRYVSFMHSGFRVAMFDGGAVLEYDGEFYVLPFDGHINWSPYGKNVSFNTKTSNLKITANEAITNHTYHLYSKDGKVPKRHGREGKTVLRKNVIKIYPTARRMILLRTEKRLFAYDPLLDRINYSLCIPKTGMIFFSGDLFLVGNKVYNLADGKFVFQCVGNPKGFKITGKVDDNKKCIDKYYRIVV